MLSLFLLLQTWGCFFRIYFLTNCVFVMLEIGTIIGVYAAYV